MQNHNHNFPVLHSNPFIQYANCVFIIIKQHLKSDGLASLAENEKNKIKWNRRKAKIVQTPSTRTTLTLTVAHTSFTYSRISRTSYAWILYVCRCRIFCIFIFQVHVNWKSFKRQTINEIPISNDFVFLSLFCARARRRDPSLSVAFLSWGCLLSAAVRGALFLVDVGFGVT